MLFFNIFEASKRILKIKTIKVLQLIDSLDAGGGERMAVHLANALSEEVELSALICTRHSGILEADVSSKVKFKCLHKKHSLDFNALLRLRNFVKKHHINIIHAHSTSFFMATLLKLSMPKIKLIWHDHYGFRYQTGLKKNIPLYICSFFFNHIIAVNEKLKLWSESTLNCKKVDYIQNFSLKNKNKDSKNSLILKGDKNAYKIIHVANLRPQKDHLTALKAIQEIIKKSYDVSYHMIGAYDDNSEYYKSIISFIKQKKIEKNVFIYGSQTNIAGLLKQANMGLLSSVSEGLPVSLIEYAQAKLPVIVTDVGQCKSVVGIYAKVITPKDYKALTDAIITNINHPEKAKQNSIFLNKKISKEFDPNLIIKKIKSIYLSVLN